MRYKASLDYLRTVICQGHKCSEVLALHLLEPVTIYSTSKRFLTYLQARKWVISQEQLKRLCEAPNVWVNVLTVAVFGRQCDPCWVSQVQEKVRAHTRGFTAQELSALLARLDAERFSVREQAAAALLRRGDVVVPALRQALEQPSSIEARTRIRRLLADLEQQPIDPRASEALALLEATAVEVREARDLLVILAQGPPHARLTKQARAALAHLDGRAQPAPHKGRR
jgi:hypothetical protein